MFICSRNRKEDYSRSDKKVESLPLEREGKCIFERLIGSRKIFALTCPPGHIIEAHGIRKGSITACVNAGSLKFFATQVPLLSTKELRLPRHACRVSSFLL